MAGSTEPGTDGVALLCFDGSDDAARAITDAGAVLGRRRAVVLTVWEPFALWEPYDPATILSAPLAKRAADAVDLEQVAQDMAREKMRQGLALAAAAGFTAEGRIAEGKPWRTICEVAEEIDAATIVVGARGLSRVGSLLLGGVSSAVAVHAKRPVLIVPGGES